MSSLRASNLTGGSGLNNDTVGYSLAEDLGPEDVTAAQALTYRPGKFDTLARPNGGSPFARLREDNTTLLYQMPASAAQVDDVRFLLDEGYLK